MAAMLHNLYAYKTGSYDEHEHKDEKLAREILGKIKLADEAETELICSAIYHHSDKLNTDNPMDEILKDADVIHHCMNDLSKAVKGNEQARFEKLCAEFGMYCDRYIFCPFNCLKNRSLASSYGLDDSIPA